MLMPRSKYQSPTLTFSTDGGTSFNSHLLNYTNQISELLKVAGYTNITDITLDTHNSSLYDRTLIGLLPQLTSLKNLTFKNVQLSGLSVIKHIATHCPSLENLTIDITSGVYITDVSPPFYAIKNNSFNLKTLTLSSGYELYEGGSEKLNNFCSKNNIKYTCLKSTPASCVKSDDVTTAMPSSASKSSSFCTIQ